MLQAAQLALDAPGAPQLDQHDTGGTPEGAANAAHAALQAGDRMIIGPLTARETAAVAPMAKQAGVPVLAFTNDPSQAQPGVWPLGITPDQQVRRLVVAARNDGRSQFAALLPENPFGAAMADALSQTTAAMGLPPASIQRYGGGFASVNSSMRVLSDYAGRRGPIDAQIRAARAQLDAEGRRKAAELAKQPVPPAPFDALLLTATGETLNEIVTLLPYYDISRSRVRILGPYLWDAEASRLGALAGAWYVAPDPAARADFVSAFAAKFGNPPPRLSDVAFDAAAIARVTAAQGFSVQALTQPVGFGGADGVLGLLPDGHVRRGLAVFEVDRGGTHMVEPSPSTLSSPGV
jgi:ABC-type branched-subunit amino acid transport system substrate-binding protein